MKKSVVYSIVFVLFLVLLAGCGSKKEENTNSASPQPTNAATHTASPEPAKEASKKVALVLPEKIGVNPFFQLMVEGLEKAGKEFNVEVKTIESADVASFEQNLRATVAEKYDLIITAAFTAVDALTKVAAENPDKSFAIIDTVVDAPNVRSVAFREYEASYLLGAAIGLSTKTNVVGMVAAIDAPLLKKYTVGFDLGLKSTNPDAKFSVNYVGSFTDPAKAKELALVHFANGADFIAGASAVGDLGVFEAAKEKGFYTSGQDIDHTVTDPEHIVLSQLKGTDTVAYETVKDFANGKLTFGVVDYGLKENGVGITFITRESKSPLSSFIGQEVVDKVKAIQEDIISGKIVLKDPTLE
ncbi:BMP family protein [Paenibacillus eucommiae]|uniref:Basic membrane protein A n=1 Tax=Paenibacillus eucommiae TaxID=1355755 RepID=A0ABS4IXE7_9BACL|nr:BMP family protein [Paenibacillus eucommiae]MBP1992254.1 basic membrane protein A [Paenibacillus eucommiae]